MTETLIVTVLAPVLIIGGAFAYVYWFRPWWAEWLERQNQAFDERVTKKVFEELLKEDEASPPSGRNE